VPEQTNSQLARHYAGAVESFGLGLLRAGEGHVTFLNVSLALMLLHRSSLEDSERVALPAPLQELKRVAHYEFDSFRYVWNVSLLVYMTTLLDTFLTDSTLFLLLVHPGAIGKNQSVSLESVLAATSPAQLLNQAALKRAREISFLSFLARAQYLDDQFGLQLSLPQATKDALEHYSGVRNVIVHDQGVYEFSLNDQKELTAKQKTCKKHPTPVSPDDLWAAKRAYSQLAYAVASNIFTRVLKVTNEPEVTRILALPYFSDKPLDPREPHEGNKPETRTD
jgi:hypothetical protein